MIDYEMLCQTIEDWRAGRRPSIDLSAPAIGAAEEYAEVEADYGDSQYTAPEYEGEGYAEPAQDYAEDEGYAEPEAGYEEVPSAGYDDEEVDYEYDGAPAPVAGGGTAPVVVGDEEFEDEP